MRFLSILICDKKLLRIIMKNALFQFDFGSVRTLADGPFCKPTVKLSYSLYTMSCLVC